MSTRTLVQEIDDIRAGRWDNKIRIDLGLPSEENDTTPAEPLATAEAAVEKAEPPQPPSLEMELEEAVEVQESAELAAEAVRSTADECEQVALTVRLYRKREVQHRHKRRSSPISLQLTYRARSRQRNKLPMMHPYVRTLIPDSRLMYIGSSYRTSNSPCQPTFS